MTMKPTSNTTKDEKVGVCPKCGGETRVAHYEPDQTSAGCETYVEMCLDCDWQGEPE